ncbi:ATP-grasp domain-containing protein [Garicola koreensis]|uniref:D-alanine-D-alanine ligase-like ATP-grasp enzyme n=1 Tax=Garicola koreensis TaxID=1262554 RepID=A0A7W5TPD7_9MICC|nr:ATP-grasp domain-containing protein [Garicola koreensis]MBB3667230.1 D-alanine-D-alanine ligase-like ATP-grasp enzyme [Garicola koreensis]
MTIFDRFPPIVADEPNTYEDPESQSIVSQQLDRGRSIGTLVTSRAAERDGASVEWHGVYTAIAKKAGRRVLLRGHMCTDTATSGQIVRDKYLTKQFLQDAGLSTPRGGLASTPEEAEAIRAELGSSVVVKPRFGGQGKGVTVNVQSASEVRDAFFAIEVRKQGVIIEEYIDGVEFRLLATPDECFGAVRRLLPHVAGNGTSTIEELISEKNDVRKRNPNNCRLPIPVDDTTEKHLHRQGLTLESILATDERIIVRNVGGISSGGEASECLDLLDRSVTTLACDAMAAIPTMEWGGADILLSAGSGTPYILELNTNAAISNSTYPVYGEPKDVGRVAWTRMLAESSVEKQERQGAAPLASPTAVEEGWDESGLEHGVQGPNLRALLVTHLEKNGWLVDVKSDRLMRASRTPHHEKWFNGVMDERFPARVSSLLRRHHTVRSILRDADVRVPRASQVIGIEQIEAYRERSKVGLALVPREMGWAGHQRYMGAQAELSLDMRSRLLAQRIVSGAHVRALCSRTRCLAVLSRDPSYIPTTEQAHRVSMAALDAVRATPGLQWAEVDVVIPEALGSAVQVEGMSVQRNLAGFNYLCAGSLELALDTIAGF